MAAAAGTAAGLWPRSGHAGADPAAPQPVARAFLRRWQALDYAGMYALLTPAQRASLSFAAFRRSYRRDAAIAGVMAVRPSSRLEAFRGRVVATVAARLRRFGWVEQSISLPVALAHGRFHVVWTAALAFPGLVPGERLAVRTLVPRGRGMIRAPGGVILAQGPAEQRSYPQGSAFAVVTGYLRAPATRAARARRVAAGWPAGRTYGQGGLERSLDQVLAGRPGFELLAIAPSGRVDRVLATRPGVAPHNVTTTLRPALQLAATAALGNRYGGVVVLNPATGAVLADAGLGMDVAQPPGSTFKMVTASAALAGGRFSLSSTFPYAHYVVLNGWHLHNFHSEYCGGTLIEAFAVSCNTVFAPLADAIGGRALVATATRYGFNQRPTVRYPAAESTTPPPSALTSDLMAGEAGIGQGGVEATALQMAATAETIGNLGLQRPPHIVLRPAAASDTQSPRRVVPVSVAAGVRSMMEAVVEYGTGTAAALPGVQVAGKTGTSDVGSGPSDAWFAAFVPAIRPRYVVAVLVVGGGVGGVTAAPIARLVMEAALNGG